MYLNSIMINDDQRIKTDARDIAVFIAVLKWPQRWEGEKKDVFYVWSPTRSQQNKNSKFITYNLQLT